MEKNGIFCNNCPIRTHSAWRDNDRPVALYGQPTPVNATLVRHHLGLSSAVKHETVNQAGEIVETSSVITPETMSKEETEQHFIECTGPVPNELIIGSKRFNLSIPLGRACAALMAIESQAANQGER